MTTPKNLINLFDFTKVLANGVAERQSEDEDRIMLRFVRAIRNNKKQPRNPDGMTLTENSIIALRRALLLLLTKISFYNSSMDAKAVEYIANSNSIYHQYYPQVWTT